MSLEIQQREREGIAILDMKGRITLGKEATTLREKLPRLAAAGQTNVILNLHDGILSIPPAWAHW